MCVARKKKRPRENKLFYGNVQSAFLFYILTIFLIKKIQTEDTNSLSRVCRHKYCKVKGKGKWKEEIARTFSTRLYSLKRT